MFIQTNSSGLRKTRWNMILACSRALYNPTPRGYHADVHPPLQPRTGRFHVGSLPLISASFFHNLFVPVRLPCRRCSGKQVHVTVENEFNMMAKRLAPVLKAHGVIDEHGAYVAPVFSTPELPPQLGEYLFQRLSPAFRFKVDPRCCRRRSPCRVRRGIRWRCSLTASCSGRGRIS